MNRRPAPARSGQPARVLAVNELINLGRQPTAGTGSAVIRRLDQRIRVFDPAHVERVVFVAC